MKRRGFLGSLSAFSLAPALPAMQVVSSGAATASFNGYQYGLAVFHARTRASLTAADLATKLRVSPAVASGMMDKMVAQGYIRTHALSAGSFQAVSRHMSSTTTRVNSTELFKRAQAKIAEKINDSIDLEADNQRAPEEESHEA